MRGIAVWMVSLSLVLAVVDTAAAADLQNGPSSGNIVDALKPRPLTRSLAAPAANAADRRFIEGLRSKATRSISIEERTKTAEIAKTRPNIDLEIAFDFDSSEIIGRSMPTLVALGTALRDPQLKGQVFLVGGHTDAQGGDAYNQALSERRAEAVKHFLVEKFGLSPENLIGVGFGKEQLKNKGDPLADENRRVQVVNLTAQ